MTSNLLMNLTEWGIFTFILGLLVVFAGMIIIIFFVSFAGKIITLNENKPKKVKDENSSLPDNTVNLTNSDDVSDEIKVIIASAIATYYSNEQPHTEFTVRKIKKL